MVSGQINPSPYSPSAHNGSVSSGVDNGFSDESDEDNNGHLVRKAEIEFEEYGNSSLIGKLCSSQKK